MRRTRGCRGARVMDVVEDTGDLDIGHRVYPCVCGYFPDLPFHELPQAIQQKSKKQVVMQRGALADTTQGTLRIGHHACRVNGHSSYVAHCDMTLGGCGRKITVET